MKTRNSALIAVFCLCLGLIPQGVHAASPVLTLKWTTAVKTWPIQPDNSFQQGKTISSTLLLKKVRTACDDLVGIDAMNIIGVSGRELGQSSSNVPKLANRVISSKWGLDENGEDNYYLKFICAGSVTAKLIGSSNLYKVGILKLPSTKVKNEIWQVGSSPFYTLAELKSAKWTVTFNLNDEACDNLSCPEDIFCEDFDGEECPVIEEAYWTPTGSN